MKNSDLKLKILPFLFVICHLAFVIDLSFSISHLAFAQEATPSSEEKARQILEAVRERIREKESAPNRKAYVGTLKSIANSTLILETRSGIKQAKVSTEAAILRMTDSTKKEVKFEDLAIGELTIAMGYVSENEVLEAKRVVVSGEPIEEPKRDAVHGIVEKVDTKERTIEIKELNKEEGYTLEITLKTEIAKKTEGEKEEVSLEEIDPGDRLVAVGVPEEEKNIFTTHRIYIIPASPAGTSTCPTCPTPAE